MTGPFENESRASIDLNTSAQWAHATKNYVIMSDSVVISPE